MQIKSKVPMLRTSFKERKAGNSFSFSFSLAISRVTIVDTPRSAKAVNKEIKARAKAELIFDLDSNRGLAMQLAAYQTYYGDWCELFNELDKINAITAKDIQRVANQYLNRDNCTVGVMNTIEN